MGFKTNNYQCSNGMVLENAYAIFYDIDITRDPVLASFAIHSSRDNAISKEPLEKKYITFEWDRQTDPIKEAYKVAGGYIREYYDHKMKITLKEKHYGPFSNWEDDIV